MFEVKLNDIGEGMTEAGISCLFVKAGDEVKADEPLVEIQTDKMTAEIPAPRPGIIKSILISTGETVKVGTTLFILEEQIPSEKREPPEKGVPYHPRILASPYTRKIARDHSVNIEEIRGTGPSGRITDEDVLAFISYSDSADIKSLSIGTIPQDTGQKPLPASALQELGLIPFRGRRKQIAKNMVHSLTVIPHCTHFEEIDVSGLSDFRNELKASGQSISAASFFVKALSVCLKEYPVFNAMLDEKQEEIRLLKEHHIGIAVDAPEGLIVPVIRNVEQKNIKTIQKEMKNLTERALSEKLTIKDISGGTFTVSNVGPLGGSIGATPIIQHPQASLVSFHKTKKRPVVTDNDEIVIRSIMNMSMSFDHRVADGAAAVRFTNRFAELIENPKMLLLELM
ncbi:dihydrolipoamide acetyltransferase family protein [Peribacillus kribbensis]|uniref:dihydrolipoamide acetyltransferase family protein n=1 Tax=Peribacillus kribbensis TaxID=356658 RepID=UPI00041F9EA8|nr:dihydrolipoamide acetyltransferase family protein [Peribacillus kribbensis]